MRPIATDVDVPWLHAMLLTSGRCHINQMSRSLKIRQIKLLQTTYSPSPMSPALSDRNRILHGTCFPGEDWGSGFSYLVPGPRFRNKPGLGLGLVLGSRLGLESLVLIDSRGFRDVGGQNLPRLIALTGLTN